LKREQIIYTASWMLHRQLIFLPQLNIFFIIFSPWKIILKTCRAYGILRYKLKAKKCDAYISKIYHIVPGKLFGSVCRGFLVLQLLRKNLAIYIKNFHLKVLQHRFVPISNLYHALKIYFYFSVAKGKLTATAQYTVLSGAWSLLCETRADPVREWNIYGRPDCLLFTYPKNLRYPNYVANRTHFNIICQKIFCI